jgi:hypothetical protein
LSHEGNGHGNPTWRHEHAKKSTKRSGIVPKRAQQPWVGWAHARRVGRSTHQQT